MIRSRSFLRKTFAIPIRKISMFLLSFIFFLTFSAFDQIQPPKPIPSASIAINTPSSGSIVTSPIFLETVFTCNPGDILRIELTDKQDKLLFRKLIIPDCQSHASLELEELIYFDTPVDATKSRLTITRTDPEDITRAIASADLSLSRDISSIIKATDSQSNFVIISPAENSLLSKGDFPVSGWIRPMEQTPIILELFSESGGLISSRQISLPVKNEGDYFFFDVVIPYSVPRILNTILVIRQVGSEIPGNVALESFTFQVGP